MVALTSACAGEPAAGREVPGSDADVRAIFAPSDDPMPFGAVPFPDDMYLGSDGRVALGDLPGEARADDAEYFDSLRAALGELDGFGAQSPVFFAFDGDLDPATLPVNPSGSAREDASVFLMDVDPGSRAPLSRVPVEVAWDPFERRLAVRPAIGRPLAEGRRYAAVVTDAVLDERGAPVGPARRFAALRDAVEVPEDALDAEARARYEPVLVALSGQGIARERVVAMSVFTVQTTSAGLREARELVWAGPPPRARRVVPLAGEALDARLGVPEEALVGLDVPGGVHHAAIGLMVHGRFDAPSFAFPQPFVHGRFARVDGGLVVRAWHEVSFTLFLPRGLDRPSRVLLFHPRIGGERSEAVALAQPLAEAGYAVLAIDGPFQGMRSAAAEPDSDNRLAGTDAPDDFGDVVGVDALREFAGLDDHAAPLPAGHPVLLRDVLRQATVDLMVAARLVREGDLDELRDADPALAGLAFADAPLAAFGEGLGGSIAMLAAATEPAVGAAVVSGPVASLGLSMVDSPALHEVFFVPLLSRAGFAERSVDEIDFQVRHPRFRPEMAVHQTLLDRGDPMAYASGLASGSAHLLIVSARHDETAPYVVTESVAQALGASIVDATAQHADLSTVRAPVRANAEADEGMVTRALFVHDVGAHDLFRNRRGVREIEPPVAAPFRRLPAPSILDNPIDAVHGQLVHFLLSWQSGAPEVRAGER